MSDIAHGPCFSCGHEFADHGKGLECSALSGYCMCLMYLTPGDQPLPARLEWLDLPTAPGYWWFRVEPSHAIHGPALVRRHVETGELVTHASDSSAEKPCSHFQRSWAGPLAVPEDWRDELSEMRLRQFVANAVGDIMEPHPS